ncbi:hypothetical protein MKX01_016870 [Papaver californicum]|nr:hypothetical protein MKX01_016870 [Papaver californicum]
MASIMSSQGLALATAMAISVSVVLITLYKQKALISTSRILVDQNSKPNPQILRPCLSADKKSTREKEKKMKKVRFADDVVVRVVTNGENISSGTCRNNQDYQFEDRNLRGNANESFFTLPGNSPLSRTPNSLFVLISPVCK